MHLSFLTMGSWEGNENFLRCRELGSELIRRGWRVSYIVNDYPFHHTGLRVHPDAKIEFVPMHSRIAELRGRRRAIRTLRPDVLHILNPAPKAMLATVGMPNLKVVGDWDEWHARSPDFSPIKKVIVRFVDRWFRRRSDLVVVASRYLQGRFSKLGVFAAYIPYATYLRSHAPTPSPFDAPTAVYMGILWPNYDHSLVFQAARLLKERGVEPRITFVGKGPAEELDKWRQFTREHRLEHVKMIGYQPEDVMWQHLRHARVLLFPIRTNLKNLCRCPAKTFAYAEARRPIITNAVGEVPPVLGDKAIYVEQTPEAFADAMQRFFDPNVEAPDVNYDLEKQSWSIRTDDLINAMGRLATGGSN